MKTSGFRSISAVFSIPFVYRETITLAATTKRWRDSEATWSDAPETTPDPFHIFIKNTGASNQSNADSGEASIHSLDPSPCTHTASTHKSSSPRNILCAISYALASQAVTCLP